jgi:hypothetical protein
VALWVCLVHRIEAVRIFANDWLGNKFARDSHFVQILAERMNEITIICTTNYARDEIPYAPIWAPNKNAYSTLRGTIHILLLVS